MEWFNALLWKDTVAHTILLCSVMIAAGVFLGKRKIPGVSLGITFVLFSGIALGYFGFYVNHQVLEFVRAFGLILFVFSTGLQVGHGFFSFFKKRGLSLNLLALIIVLLGGLTVLSIHFITGMSMPMLVGVTSGAVTNTPGLGTAQDALNQMMEGMSGAPALAYATVYPLTMFLMIFIAQLLILVF